MGAAAVIGGGLALSAGATVYSTSKQSKAQNKALKTLQGAEGVYESIDLDELQNLASKAARESAVGSQQLESELAPGVAQTRKELQSQVADELALGGRLDTDTINAVTRGATAAANNAGLYGGGGPLTSAMLGLTAREVANERKDRAERLLAANPEPNAGLSASELASQYVSDKTNLNQIRQNMLSGTATSQLQQGKLYGDAATSIAGLLSGAASKYATATP